MTFLGGWEGWGLIGDLPAGDGLGEGDLVGGFAAGFNGHLREGGEDVGGLGPDGDVLHLVVVGDLGLGEAARIFGGWGEVVDAGDGAVAVAESGGVAGASGGGGVAGGGD